MMSFKSKSLAGLLLTLAGSLFQSAVHAETSFGFTSSPASFIGMGQTAYLTESDGYQIGAFLGFNNVLQIYVIGNNSLYNPYRNLLPSGFQAQPTAPSDWWEIAAAIGGERYPAVGTFEDPAGDPTVAQPFIYFIGNHHSTNQTAGKFEIYELSIGSDGKINSLAMDFTVYEENQPSKWDFGSVRFNSDIPSSIPEPSTFLMCVGGFAALMLVARVTGTKDRMSNA